VAPSEPPVRETLSRIARYLSDVKQTRIPRDPNQRAKAVVELATGQRSPEPVREKDPAAIARGRLGGAKGGPARAAKLTAEQRSESARRAAKARWVRERG
jgi:hypothetical protein